MTYCSGRISPELAPQLERHIAACPACRQFVEQQQAVWTALDSWEPARVSLDFDRRLYRRIETRANASWWSGIFQPFSRLSFRPAMSLAAACVTVAAFLIVREPPAVDAPQARSESVEVEQVEGTLEDIEMLRQLDALGLSAKEVSPRSL